MRSRLAILSGLVMGIGFGLVGCETMQHGANSDSRGLSQFRSQAKALARMLSAYHSSHGRYPTNDEGLSVVADAAKRQAEHDYLHGGELARWRVTASGVLSWWGDPIIYENRRGLPSSAFRPVRDGVSAGYAYRVDDGIYLRSVGAEQAAPRVHSRDVRWAWTAGLSLVSGTALLAVYVIGALRVSRPARWHMQTLRAVGITIWGLLVALVVALPVLLVLGLGCGCPGMQIPRTPALTKSYTTSMRAYCDKGIISRQTCDKRIAALRLDAKDPLYRRH